MVGSTKNDIAWNEVESALDLTGRIARCGFVLLDAKELEEHGKRQPRLMAKIDSAGQLPKLFRDRGWGILPVSRGQYVIGNFNIFSDIPKAEGSPSVIKPVRGLETLSMGGHLTESAAIFLMHATGELENFSNEKSPVLTFFGRRGGGTFDFWIEGRKVRVDRTQMEIDALFEGEGSILLVEAKREGHPTFVVRQLYYPWRTLEAECNKPVRPMYLIVGDTGVRLIEFAFDDRENYSSIRVVAQKRWVFASESWDDVTLSELAQQPLKSQPEGVPFPQADSIDRVIRIVAAVAAGLRDKAVLAEEEDFVGRQVDYYLNAARFLGFLDYGSDGAIVLTERGRALMDCPAPDRSLPVARAMFELSPFRRVLAGEGPEVVVGDEAPDLSGKTVQRRAQTVRAWVNWAKEQACARELSG